VLNEPGKFGAKMFSHYMDIVIFVLGYFILTHPVEMHGNVNIDGCYYWTV